MELQDAIRSRVSVRQFETKKIERDKIDKILEMGFCAPTASNRQPWKIWVIEDEAIIGRMGDATPYASPARRAPLVIVIGNDKDISSDIGIEDCSAMIQNMLLTITDLGLGAVWIGTWPHLDRQENVRAILDIPDTIDIASYIAIGYPAETPAIKNKWNDSKIVWV